jgi:stage II sporulation protein D
VRVRSGAEARIVTLPLEDYVVGVVLGEVALGAFPPATARAVAQLQAILARTYAVGHLGRHAREGFDLCAETHCQVYRTERGAPATILDLVRAAVDATRGLLIVYQGRPIDAVYHADCGGRTSDARAVWGHGPVPYLRATADPFCRRRPSPDWRFDVAARDLRHLLDRDERTRVGGALRRIRILARDSSDRVLRVALEGAWTRVVRGEDLREVLAAGLGGPALRSARFTVTRQGEQFVFVGRGAGHGVGLCQAGAWARLAAGRTLSEVLRAYYPGTTLAPLGRSLTSP